MIKLDWAQWTGQKLLNAAYSLTHQIHAEEEVLRSDKAYVNSMKKVLRHDDEPVRTKIKDREDKIADLRAQRDLINKEILRRMGE